MSADQAASEAMIWDLSHRVRRTQIARLNGVHALGAHPMPALVIRVVMCHR